MVTKRARHESSYQMCKREEGTNTVIEVSASAQEAVLASWSRIAARAMQTEAVTSSSDLIPAVYFLLQTSGIRWCVVHSRPLLPDKKGWMCLKFHAGQMPDTPTKMISLSH